MRGLHGWFRKWSNGRAILRAQARGARRHPRCTRTGGSTENHGDSMNKLLLSVFLVGACALSADPIQNVVVYKEPGRFGGWPANNGIWIWGDEIVVGFIQGYFKNKQQGHAIDGEKGEITRFARSKDGGR